MRIRQALVVFVLTGLITGCASVARRSEITDLNRIYRVQANQTLFAKDARGQVIPKSLNRPADAALYERGDTLYAEFVAAKLPVSDNDPRTIDQSDSLASMFVHYNRRIDQVEEKSPWFYYQLTTFDVDLFTIPFKYRFPGRRATGPAFDQCKSGRIHRRSLRSGPLPEHLLPA